jgi:hypothetical protein
LETGVRSRLSCDRRFAYKGSTRNGITTNDYDRTAAAL